MAHFLGGEITGAPKIAPLGIFGAILSGLGVGYLSHSPIAQQIPTAWDWLVATVLSSILTFVVIWLVWMVVVVAFMGYVYTLNQRGVR